MKKKNDPFFSSAVTHSLVLYGTLYGDLWPEAQSERGETHHSLHYPSVFLSAHTTGSVLISTHTTIWDTWIWMPASHPGDQGVGWKVRVSLDGISRKSGQADRHVQELKSDLGPWYSISKVWWKCGHLYRFLNWSRAGIRSLPDYTFLFLHSHNMAYFSTFSLICFCSGVARLYSTQ